MEKQTKPKKPKQEKPKQQETKQPKAKQPTKQQATRSYATEGKFEAGNEEMREQGWKLTHQTSHKDQYNVGKGCCLGVIFLPLALFGRGKSSIIATYEK